MLCHGPQGDGKSLRQGLRAAQWGAMKGPEFSPPTPRRGVQVERESEKEGRGRKGGEKEEGRGEEGRGRERRGEEGRRREGREGREGERREERGGKRREGKPGGSWKPDQGSVYEKGETVKMLCNDKRISS